jgi:hypothetical protein
MRGILPLQEVVDEIIVAIVVVVIASVSVLE